MVKLLKEMVFSFGGFVVFSLLFITCLPVLFVRSCEEEKIVSGVIIEHSVTSTKHGDAIYNTLVRYDNTDLGIRNETDVDLYVLPVGTRIEKEKWVYKK